MAAERWATFDCYGTLIDWMGGIRDTLSDLWPEHDAELLLSAYHEIEPEVQRGRAVPYRQVLAESLELAHREGSSPVRRSLRSPTALPWPPFRCRLAGEPGSAAGNAVLSNTDPTCSTRRRPDRRPGGPPDHYGEAGSYKPAHGHWDRFFEASGADRERHVHVAASLYHDIAPAAELGLRAVWINRLHETSELPRAAELADLGPLPDVLEDLVGV
jgi:2-haloacid dehalogenase